MDTRSALRNRNERKELAKKGLIECLDYRSLNRLVYNDLKT